MELKDAPGWEMAKAANTDAYGAACINYAERWANLMEVQINKAPLVGTNDTFDAAVERTIKAHAKQTSHDADTEGITGFMYGAAVSILSLTWKHGEALRRWHNLDTQLGTEGERANESGGVLNPALLNIGE